MAIASAMRERTSDKTKRLKPPNFTGWGSEPSATRRQTVAREQPRSFAVSRSDIAGVAVLVLAGGGMFQTH
jgi:hypothetical protein